MKVFGLESAVSEGKESLFLNSGVSFERVKSFDDKKAKFRAPFAVYLASAQPLLSMGIHRLEECPQALVVAFEFGDDLLLATPEF